MKMPVSFLLSVLVFGVVPLVSEESAPSVESPLSATELALQLDPKFVKLDAAGSAFLLWEKEPITVAQVLELSPWDLMKVYQTLTHQALLLSRFGQGEGDELTAAWKQKLAEFLVRHEPATAELSDDLFAPELVVWDPGYVQKQNEWGQWFITIDRRDIVQKDLATLSPLEVQQAIEVLTNRTYPVEFVMEHLEAFRAQLTVHQRVVQAALEGGGH